MGPGGKALDVGCGRQPFRRVLEGYGFAYTGMDTQAAEGVTHVAAIDGALPPETIAEGPFAFLLCTEVLEHVADWTAAFENFARLTSAGSKVLLTCRTFIRSTRSPTTSGGQPRTPSGTMLRRPASALSRWSKLAMHGM